MGPTRELGLGLRMELGLELGLEPARGWVWVWVWGWVWAWSGSVIRVSSRGLGPGGPVVWSPVELELGLGLRMGLKLGMGLVWIRDLCLEPRAGGRGPGGPWS